MGDFGSMIRYRRTQLGLTLEDVARKVGITPGALSHIESGRRLPQPQNAAAIAGVLGIEPETVLDQLDVAHAERRRESASDIDPKARFRKKRPGAGAQPTAGYSGFSARPIGALFESGEAPDELGMDSATGQRSIAPDPEGMAAGQPRAYEGQMRYRSELRRGADTDSWRDAARWSNDPSTRIEALDALADQASEAIRTLRGMLGDEDPRIRAEARRLLLELDVRLPEE